MSRVLYGIGAGPGDPELITLLGLRRLREADRVFLPATRPGGSYARTIVDAYLDPQRQPVIELVCPAYRNRSALEARWLELARVVCAEIPEGGSAAFVCEGDPSLYSTFSYLRTALVALKADIQIQVVPGIDSVAASAALAGIDLARWDERLLITPAPSTPEALTGLLEQAQTVAMLKVTAIAPLLNALDRLDGAASAALICRAGRPEQVTSTDVAAMRTLEPDYFTTLLIRRAAP